MWVHTHTHTHTQREWESKCGTMLAIGKSGWLVWVFFFFLVSVRFLKLKKLLKRLAAHSQKSLFIPEDFLKEIWFIVDLLTKDSGSQESTWDAEYGFSIAEAIFISVSLFRTHTTWLSQLWCVGECGLMKQALWFQYKRVSQKPANFTAW